MISFLQSQRLIHHEIPPLRKEARLLKDVLGYVLAENIRAPISLPIADNSAMDGFVLRSRDCVLATPKNPVLLKIQGVIKAGDPGKIAGPGLCFRIMTGALIPKGADSVLAKEEAEINRDDLVIRAPVARGRHIRKHAEEIRKGTCVLRKNSIVNPGTVGFLASLGIQSVNVISRPRVSVIATGSELIRPGQILTSGKIYESNSGMIRACLGQMGLAPILTKKMKDTPKTLMNGIQSALIKSDVVILTGGVSVGDYDYVKEVLSRLGVRQIFWKVKQKPGKPIWFGRKSNTLIFGLPGNPASVFICFYEYIYPALRLMSGFSHPQLIQKNFWIENDYSRDPEKILFLKGKINTQKKMTAVKVLGHQASHMLSSLHETDAIVRIEPGEGMVKKNDLVQADLLPHGSGNDPTTCLLAEGKPRRGVRSYELKQVVG